MCVREGQRFNWHLRQEADRLDRTDREPVPEQRKVERRDRQTGIQVRQERQKDSARTGTGRK